MKQTLDRNTVDQVIAAGPYTDHWQSLCQHSIPQWFQRGKLGIFIHWGIYSVPAFGNEWYSRNMYDPNHREFAHHLQTYGKQDVFGYKDFIPMFRAENFDPQAWAAFFKESGARFVMPVAEHHDGFAMYQTAFNRWNAANMGPCRDVVGELKQACEAENLTFCASTHRAEHYFFMNMGRCIESDVAQPRFVLVPRATLFSISFVLWPKKDNKFTFFIVFSSLTYSLYYNFKKNSLNICKFIKMLMI